MLKEIKEFLSEYEEYNVKGLTLLKIFRMAPFGTHIFVCDSPNWHGWGTTIEYENINVIIILNTCLYSSINNLVETCSHECFHAVYRLLGNTFKSPLGEDNEEIYAYFLGELTRKVFDIATDSKHFCAANEPKKKKTTSSRKSQSKNRQS